MDNIEESLHSVDVLVEKKEETSVNSTLNDVLNNPVGAIDYKEDQLYTPTHIKKKVEYNAFLRALKKNDFTTAYMMAKALRVSPETIAQWLRTPKAVKIMQTDIQFYVEKIKASKDWKASAYLLDKVTGADEVKQQAQTTLIGLTINLPKP